MDEDDKTLCVKARQWHATWKRDQGHGWGATARPRVVAEAAGDELLFCLSDERGRPVHEGDCEFSGTCAQ